jgi:hypothetical protein
MQASDAKAKGWQMTITPVGERYSCDAHLMHQKL